MSDQAVFIRPKYCFRLNFSESKKVYLGIVMSLSGENGFLWPLGESSQRRFPSCPKIYSTTI